MDEAGVRASAEAHGRALAEGDVRRAGADLAQEAMESAARVMRDLPTPISGAEVLAVAPAGDEWLARIRYSGEASTSTVESRWAERDGRPVIVGLRVVEAEEG